MRNRLKKAVMSLIICTISLGPFPSLSFAGHHTTYFQGSNTVWQNLSVEQNGVIWGTLVGAGIGGGVVGSILGKFMGKMIDHDSRGFDFLLTTSGFILGLGAGVVTGYFVLDGEKNELSLQSIDFASRPNYLNHFKKEEIDLYNYELPEYNILLKIMCEKISALRKNKPINQQELLDLISDLYNDHLDSGIISEKSVELAATIFAGALSNEAESIK